MKHYQPHSVADGSGLGVIITRQPETGKRELKMTILAGAGRSCLQRSGCIRESPTAARRGMAFEEEREQTEFPSAG